MSEYEVKMTLKSIFLRYLFISLILLILTILLGEQVLVYIFALSIVVPVVVCAGSFCSLFTGGLLFGFLSGWIVPSIKFGLKGAIVSTIALVPYAILISVIDVSFLPIYELPAFGSW